MADTSTNDSTAPPAAEAGARGSRRRFLGWMSRSLLGLWAVGAVGVAWAYLRPRGHGHRLSERTVSVGRLDELRIGEARLVRHGTTPFFVVRLDAARVIAISAVCTHLRCILDFDRDRRGLACPCHDGRFDLAGKVLSGPPPRPLATYEVSVRAGEIVVQL
jgi:cytochrome b6-f complex iron-sulfur subunit